jgi:uncharacterized RDD family membrane protein YckC
MMDANSTTSPVDTRYAGFVARLKAFAFDYLPIAAYIIFLFGTTMAVARGMNAVGRPMAWPENPLLADLLAFLILVLPVILYFTLQESSPRRSTWGKRKVGLQVVNEKGERLTRWRAFIRSLLKLLPWQIAHNGLLRWEGWPFAPEEPSLMVLIRFGLVYLLVGVYIASALISEKHRTPYDWVAGSYVIHTPENRL